MRKLTEFIQKIEGHKNPKDELASWVNKKSQNN